MRIMVVGQDGQREILTVVGPLLVRESNRESGMSSFRDASGMDYFFNDVDGTYDGWGMEHLPPIEEGASDAIVERVQESREFV